MKVYELAKRMGIDSMSLLDNLKQSGVVVRSHMSSLNQEQIDKVKEYISNQIEAVKKKTTKKKTARKKTAAASTAKIEKKIKPITRKKVIKRKAASEKARSEGLKETTKEILQEVEEKIAIAEMDSVKEEVLEASTEKEEVKGDALSTDEMLDQSLTNRGLKIVENAPPPGEATESKGVNVQATPSDSEASFKRGRAELKSGKGMFKPASSVLLDREEEYRRKATNLDKYEKDQQVRVTDFRKREVVFQPRKRKIPIGKTLKKTFITTPGQQKRKIRIEDEISLLELSIRIGKKPKFLIDKAAGLGVEEPKSDTLLDFDTAQLLASEFSYEIEDASFDEDKILKQEQMEEAMEPRPPIIAVMGHVDHGKTTLLDKIRNSSVAEKEAGSITQHMSAYSVSVDKLNLTFIDTPGHEAFNIMRERGASVTDIVVLVVAADDGVMSQTKEAINYAQKAGASILVAINKIDIPDINIEPIKKALADNNVLIEEWGGDIPIVQISAKNEKGIKELLETLKLQAEILELKASLKCRASGVILESSMKKGRGVVADVLVMAGTLKGGDCIVCGTIYGKVKSIQNDQGKSVKEVKPGYAASFIGFNEVVPAEEKFYVVPSEANAKAIVEHRKERIRKEKTSSKKEEMTLDELFAAQDAEVGKKILNVILKADTYGSLEVIEDIVKKDYSDEINLKVVSKSVGMIIESDAILAHTSGSHIFAFNVKADKLGRDFIKAKKVPFHTEAIIYKLVEKLKEIMESILDPIKLEKLTGKAEVKQVFNISNVNKIAGSVVVNGKISRDSFIRVYRDGEKRTEGFITSLKRFKNDAKEVLEGQECGIGVENYIDISEGDVMEAFLVEYEKAKL